MEFARIARRQPTLLETLRAVASAVSDAVGFATVVINAYRADHDVYEVVTVHGSERATGILSARSPSPRRGSRCWTTASAVTGSTSSPEGSLSLEDPTVTWYRPKLNARTPELTGEAWHNDDALFARLEGSGGRPYGIISVDEPSRDCAPTISSS
jgi:hypothetical protein